MEVGKLLPGLGDRPFEQQDGPDLRRGKLASGLPLERVVDLPAHPLRLLCVARPEEEEEIAVVDSDLEPLSPAVARLEAEHVLEVADSDRREHLNAFENLVAVLRGVRDERDAVASCFVALRLVPRGHSRFAAVDLELELDAPDRGGVEADVQRAEDRKS